MKFSKITLFGGIMFAMTLTISGCHSNPDASETDTKSMEKIVVGDDYTPFSYMDVNGNQTGIDIICKLVGRK